MENDRVDETQYGKYCYEAYAESCGNKTWDGKDMMKWENIPLEKQLHWIRGGNEAVDRYRRHLESYRC